MLTLYLLGNEEDYGIEYDREDESWNLVSVARRDPDHGNGMVVDTLGVSSSSLSTVSSRTSPSFQSPTPGNYHQIVQDLDDYCYMMAGKHYLDEENEQYDFTRKGKGTRSRRGVEYNAKRTKICNCR